MDSEAAGAVLEAAGVEELLRAGAASATVGALGELKKGAVAYIGAVAAAEADSLHVARPLRSVSRMELRLCVATAAAR